MSANLLSALHSYYSSVTFRVSAKLFITLSHILPIQLKTSQIALFIKANTQDKEDTLFTPWTVLGKNVCFYLE